MTTTPPESPPQSPGADHGPRPGADQWRDVSRLRRTTGNHRNIAGVAGGLARHFDIDPVIVRVAFVVLAIFGGGGLLLYGALWLLLPPDDGGSANISLDQRGLTIALVAIAILGGLAVLGNTWGGYDWPWQLVVLAVAAILIVRHQTSRRADESGPTPYDVHPPAAPPSSAQVAPMSGPTPTQVSSPNAGPNAGPAPGPPPSSLFPPSGGYLAPAFTPRPPNPRKRGPILFGYTLALLALALGLLGLADVTGGDVALSAYPALATAICGAMLLLGSFYGRAGGIILLGLASTMALGLGVALEQAAEHQVVRQPLSAAQVASTYNIGGGRLTLDLTRVADPANLDGRTIRVQGGAGRLVILLPSNMDVQGTATIGGPGQANVFDAHQDGVAIDLRHDRDATNAVADITIAAELGTGRIDIQTEGAPTP